MNLSRRQILKLGPVLTLAGQMSKLGATVSIVFEDIEIDEEAIGRALHLCKMHYNKETNSAEMEVTVDEEGMWQAIRVVDDRGRRWITDGKSLRYGDTVIPLDEDAA